MGILAIVVSLPAALETFSPGEFVIRRQIGQLGFATETEWQYNRGGVPVRPNPLDPTQPKRTVEASGNVVRLFDAKLDDDSRVLLKEFVGDARSIGGNEGAMYEQLYERATMAGQVNGRPPQLGTLLGTMMADASFTTDSFRAQWESALPGILPPSADGLWLVFRWEGLSTVAGFPRQPQQRAWFDFDGRAAIAARRVYTKNACRRILETVGWLHGQGIVHRSLGSSSLILNTYDQTVSSDSLQVKLIDLGFSTTASRISPEEVAAAMARGAPSPLDVIPFLTRADDMHALTYVLLELVLGSACPPPVADPVTGRLNGEGSEAPSSDLQTLKRLVEDVFSDDVCGEFRAYCANEAAWAPAVALLDESGGAGWRIVQQLAKCRDASSEEAEGATCQRLLESPWFADT